MTRWWEGSKISKNGWRLLWTAPKKTTANPESIEKQQQQVQKISLHFFQTSYLSSHGIKAFPSSRCCDMLLPSPSSPLFLSFHIMCSTASKKGAKYFPENRPPSYPFFLSQFPSYNGYNHIMLSIVYFYSFFISFDSIRWEKTDFCCPFVHDQSKK